MNRPILIVGIYAPSALNVHWYNLQKRFIASTTTVPHEFRVYLNGVDPEGFEPDDILEISSTNEGHAIALQRVAEHFARREHSAYLLLDSDCFPIASGWHNVLLKQMQRFGKQFAAPVRVENLDLFPHPCAMFFLPSALQSGCLDFAHATAKNLLGVDINDPCAAMQGQCENLLPLMRTNVLNVHPIAAAIYHHLFYHHSVGSRGIFYRVLNKFAYYDHWHNVADDNRCLKKLLDALLRDPEGFVASLMGVGANATVNHADSINKRNIEYA